MTRCPPRVTRVTRELPPELLPRTECLRDVVRRLLPYWYDGIVPDLAAGRTVLVVAHGNSLRALVKHLDRIGDAAIAELNIPMLETSIHPEQANAATMASARKMLLRLLRIVLPF